MCKKKKKKYNEKGFGLYMFHWILEKKNTIVTLKFNA